MCHSWEERSKFSPFTKVNSSFHISKMNINMSTDKNKNLDGFPTGSQSEVSILKFRFPSSGLIICLICMDFHTCQTLNTCIHIYLNFRLLQGWIYMFASSIKYHFVALDILLFKLFFSDSIDLVGGRTL